MPAHPDAGFVTAAESVIVTASDTATVAVTETVSVGAASRGRVGDRSRCSHSGNVRRRSRFLSAGGTPAPTSTVVTTGNPASGIRVGGFPTSAQMGVYCSSVTSVAPVPPRLPGG
jgi:hypothetical protein